MCPTSSTAGLCLVAAQANNAAWTIKSKAAVQSAVRRVIVQKAIGPSA
jgi:hypothetical protein